MKLIVNGVGLRCEAITKKGDRCPHDAEYLGGAREVLCCHVHADRAKQRKLTREERIELMATRGVPAGGEA